MSVNRSSSTGVGQNSILSYAASRNRKRWPVVVAVVLATSVFAILAVSALRHAHAQGLERGTELGYREGFKEGVKAEVDARVRVPVTEAMQLSEVNLDSVLRSLAQVNEDRSTEAIGDAIDETHRAVIDELSRVYGLTADERAAAFQQFEDQRDDEVAAYIDSLTRIEVSRTDGDSSELFDLRTYEAASDFSVVLADRSCQAFSFAMSYSPAGTTQKHMLKGLCGIVAHELLMPLTTALRDRALVIDIEASRSELKEHLRTAIAELAVAEDRLATTFSRDFTRTFFADTWAEFHSTATLEINASGVIKAGYDLREYFDLTVDHMDKRLIVTLPEPRILSRDIELEVASDRDGFLSKVTPEKRTQALRQIRSELQRRAVQGGLLVEAKEKVEGLVQIIYSPLSYLPEGSYAVEVQFSDGISISRSRLN